MRVLPVLAAGVFLLGAAWQTNLPAPLASHFEKLTAAKALSVTYTGRIVGEAAVPYQLSMAKPNLFKLTTPDGFVLSDGKKLYTFTKKDNSYTEAPLDDATLAAFAQRPEVFAWAGFLSKAPASEITAAKVGAQRTIQGNKVTEVELGLKGEGRSANLYLDPKVGIARGYTLKTGGKDYLVLASALETPETKVEEFAFVAPAGAKKTEAATAVTFAQVNAILSSSCMPCHSAQNRRGQVDLTTYEGVLASVTPGDGKGSRLVRSLHAPGMRRMPKNRPPLTDEQESVIVRWIDAGAKN
jgi:outer membrane lipoprotein-sorting protein